LEASAGRRRKAKGLAAVAPEATDDRKGITKDQSCAACSVLLKDTPAAGVSMSKRCGAAAKPAAPRVSSFKCTTTTAASLRSTRLGQGVDEDHDEDHDDDDSFEEDDVEVARCSGPGASTERAAAPRLPSGRREPSAPGVFSFKAPTGSVKAREQAKAVADAVVSFGGGARRSGYGRVPT